MKNTTLIILNILFLFSCDTTDKTIPESPKEKTVEKKIEKKEEEIPLGTFRVKSENKPELNPIKNSEQLIIALVPDDETIEGQLWTFDKNGDDWENKMNKIPVNIGKNGLVWGRDELPNEIKGGYFKQEGDGKAPAGIFSLGTAFGEFKSRPENMKWDFLPTNVSLKCVDDVKNEYYNQITDIGHIEESWDSAEEMLRTKDGLYELGVFVNHNTPAEAGSGSCIFLHVWRAKGKPTQGCTAMELDNMRSILTWLDRTKNPRFILMTEKEYPVLQEWFGLPNCG